MDAAEMRALWGYEGMRSRSALPWYAGDMCGPVGVTWGMSGVKLG